MTNKTTHTPEQMEREAVRREIAAYYHETQARHIRAAADSWRAAIAKAEEAH